MNCKPGDLAVVVGKNPYEGMLVTVLFAAPCHEFRLPNGDRSVGGNVGDWVIQFQRPVTAYRLGAVFPHLTTVGVGGDRWLRPIRDNDREDETLQWAPVPVKEIA